MTSGYLKIAATVEVIPQSMSHISELLQKRLPTLL